MGYYNRHGYVGEYKGRDVYVIDREVYTRDKIDSPYIYAIRRKNREELDLVFHGKCFGAMWDDGTIVNFRTQTPWVFKEPKKKKKKRIEVKVERKEESVNIDNYDFSVDFSEYEAVVNNVFKNLNKWWKDLEKEGTQMEDDWA